MFSEWNNAYNLQLIEVFFSFLFFYGSVSVLWMTEKCCLEENSEKCSGLVKQRMNQEGGKIGHL